jgi:hypothetical protein
MSRESRRREDEAAREWKGAYRPYDILKEASIALGVVLALAVVLTLLFSSPDLKPSTVQTWSRGDPVDFVTTATTELDGSSGTGGYGPPYNHASDGQHIAFIYLAKWLGVSHPINSAQDFVLAPLRSISGQPALDSALAAYQAAPANTQTTWTSAYEKALGNATTNPNGSIKVKPGNYGPLPAMMGSLLTFAQSGGLDGALLTSKQFYQTDYTKPLLFMADGGVLATRAQQQHPVGNDERDRQLPRAGLAVALHLLVSDQTVLDLGQRRHPRDGRNGRAEPRIHPDSIHPRSPRSSAENPDLQADLARSLSHPASRQCLA